MTEEFFRFPHIPHLVWLGNGKPRGDKVLSSTEARSLLSREVVVEEKLDGANLGFSVGPDATLHAQNRGAYLRGPFQGQFARLVPWLALHEETLRYALGERLIAFGEWCAAKHSLDYDQLPDWWLLFDIYDRHEGRFWSTVRRNDWARLLGLTVVPEQDHQRLNLAQLEERLLTEGSSCRHGHMEGLMVRQEDKDWLTKRAKLVRPEFTQAIEEHWRSRAIEWNMLSTAKRWTASEPIR